MRRKDFFLGTALTVALVSAVMAIGLLVLSMIEHGLNGWGTDLHFFHLPYLNDGFLLTQLWIYFIVLVHMFFFGMVISCVYRRFGPRGMLITSLILFVLLSLGSFALTYYEFWSDVFKWISGYSAAGLSLGILILTVAYAATSYLLLRKATV